MMDEETSGKTELWKFCNRVHKGLRQANSDYTRGDYVVVIHPAMFALLAIEYNTARSDWSGHVSFYRPNPMVFGITIAVDSTLGEEDVRLRKDIEI